MRIVFDTNTLVSAFLFPNSVPGQCVHSYSRFVNILASEDTLQEFLRVINYPKFEKYLTQNDRQTAIKHLIHTTTFVEVTIKVNDCRDIHDNIFLDLALDGSADIIVTGDNDLLILHPYKNIPIITPKHFLEVLANRIK